MTSKDINRLPDDGYVIFPLSISRLQTGQKPEKIMQFLSVLDKKLNLPTNDVVFLYTNGLYFNSDELAIDLRKKTNAIMLYHRSRLKKLIIKKRTYFPAAFHFLPFDYVILNSDSFQNFFDILKKTYTKDKKFKDLVIKSLGKRPKTEANINFLLEEIAVAHIIREKLVEFPRSLVKTDSYRLIAYPGKPYGVEAYVWQNNILPRKDNKSLGRYYNSTYDPESKTLYKFEEFILD